MSIRSIKVAASLCTGLLLLTANAKAELINNNAFLYADNVIAGIDSTGSFGSTTDVASGPFAGGTIGYASDPTRQGFTGNYDGDFFLPGTSEEGWAVTVNGNTYNNNRSIQTFTPDIPGTLSNFVENSRFSSVEWNGEIENLEVKQTFKTYNAGLAIIMDVELTNVSNSTMTDVYYMRTVDADNNAFNPNLPSNTFETTNRILQQGDMGTAAVEATQANGALGNGEHSVLTLSAYTNRGRVSYGSVDTSHNRNIAVRSPISVYDGSNGQFDSGSVTSDASISSAVKFDQILPGEKVQFTMSYSLAPLKPPTLELDEDNSSKLSNGNFKQVYLLGSSGVPLSDSDVVASTSTSSFDGLTVKIINPYQGDDLSMVSLPAGIELDNESPNNATEINLKGRAGANAYVEAIKAIRFENPNLDASLNTREISIQILDEVLSLSNSSEARVFITVPLVIADPIAGDNIINVDEMASGLSLTGTTAPNSDVVVTLTDDSGTVVSSTTTSDDNGDWEATFTQAQVASLDEGTLTVNATATDPNGHITTATSSVTKDTVVELSITSPSNQALINAQEVLVEGQSDPNASVEVSTTGGISCSTTANAQGEWSCSLTSLDKGVTYPITVTATDAHNNENTAQTSVTVSNLSLGVTAPLNGQDADDETPLITGTTDPNVDITVTTEFGDVCTTVSDQNGNWSCHLAEMPIGGPHDITVKAVNASAGTETTLPWTLMVPDRPLVVTQPATDDVNTQIPFVLKGTSNPNAEVTVTGPNGENCTTTSDVLGNWSCSISDVRTGDNQQFIIRTTLSDGTTEAVTRNLNITIFDGAVETILEGGGTFNFILFPLLLLIVVIRKFYKNTKLDQHLGSIK